MLPLESEWIGNKIREIGGAKNVSLLNVGSSTLHFRTVVQPHIDKNIFEKLGNNFSITHLDMKQADGVDIVGDLMNNQFLSSIRETFDIILCSNLLEHVENPQKVIDRLEQIVRPGGHIVVTGPHLFPYHNDPIDTMFRPSPTELAAMFKNSRLVEGTVITEKGSHFSIVKSDLTLGVKIIARMFMPFYKFQNWRQIVKGVPDFFKHFEVVAVLMQKPL